MNSQLDNINHARLRERSLTRYNQSRPRTDPRSRPGIEQMDELLAQLRPYEPGYLPIPDSPQDPSVAPQIENPKSKIQNPKSDFGARPESTTFLERRGFFPNSSYVQMRLDHISSQPEPRVPEGFHFRPITDTGR